MATEARRGGSQPSEGAARRPHRRRLPPLDCGATNPRTSPVLQLQQLFDQLCQAVPEGRPPGARRPGVQHSRWEHQYSEGQLAEVAPLAAAVRQLCSAHEACAEALVGAAVGLAGARLQHTLAALEAAGEGLLADFLRASVYSAKLTQQPRTAPGSASPQAGPEGAAGVAMTAARALRGTHAPPVQPGSTAQHEAWREAAYAAALREDDASAIVVPQVFRTKLYWGRGGRRGQQSGWRPGLLAGAGVPAAALSDSSARELALAAAEAPPGADPSRSASHSPGGRPQRPSLQHRALQHALAGPHFQRQLAAARASQQHHSEEGGGEALASEQSRYAELLLEMGLLGGCGASSGGDAGSGTQGGQQGDGAACDGGGVEAQAPPAAGAAARCPDEVDALDGTGGRTEQNDEAASSSSSPGAAVCALPAAAAAAAAKAALVRRPWDELESIVLLSSARA